MGTWQGKMTDLRQRVTLVASGALAGQIRHAGVCHERTGSECLAQNLPARPRRLTSLPVCGPVPLSLPLGGCFYLFPLLLSLSNLVAGCYVSLSTCVGAPFFLSLPHPTGRGFPSLSSILLPPPPRRSLFSYFSGSLFSPLFRLCLAISLVFLPLPDTSSSSSVSLSLSPHTHAGPSHAWPPSPGDQLRTYSGAISPALLML